jgi:hypothetical protein
VCAPFVRVEPAGAQVAKEKCVSVGLALMFVCLHHDEILDVGKRVVLVKVRGLLKWVVLL